MDERATRQDEEQYSARQVEIEFRVGSRRERSRVDALLLGSRLDISAPIAPAELFRPDWAHCWHRKGYLSYGRKPIAAYERPALIIGCRAGDLVALRASSAIAGCVSRSGSENAITVRPPKDHATVPATHVPDRNSIFTASPLKRAKVPSSCRAPCEKSTTVAD